MLSIFDYCAVSKAEAERAVIDFDDNEASIGLNIEDCRQAAEYRSGECLSSSMYKGIIFNSLDRQCGYGNDFTAILNLVLCAGSFCPICDLDVEKPILRPSI